jgi:ribonuclease BN (tRNA processing enzyme)
MSMPDPVTVRFLGTSGWFDSPAGNTLSILLDAQPCPVVLDAGFGIAKLDRYLAEGSSATLLLSHFHLDHVAGLHVLAKFPSL